MSYGKILLLISALYLCQAATVLARQKEKQVNLEEILLKFREEHNFSFSFDPELIRGFSATVPDGSAGDAKEILQAVMKQVPFTIEFLEDGYAIVKTRPVKLELTVKEKATSEPVPGVYVKKGNTYLEQVSDASGRVALTVSWQKKDSLSFEFQGYATARHAIIDLLRGSVQTIYLSEGVTVLDELVITSYLGQGISAHQRNHSLKIKTEDLGILPGDSNKDLLLSLRSLPGVSTVTGRAGDLRVRGSTTDQTLLLYNNIPIYHKGYYYGTVSPFSTDIVDEVKVYRSGFSPRLGGRVGGAIEINNNFSVPEKLRAGITTSSVYAGAYVKTPLIEDKLGLSISARTSLPNDFRSPLKNEYEKLVIEGSNIDDISQLRGNSRDPLELDFTDVSGVVSFQASRKDKLLLNFLSIENNNSFNLIFGRENTTTVTTSSLDNRGLNLQWDHNFAKWKNSTTLTYGEYEYATANVVKDLADDRQLSEVSRLNTLNTYKASNTLSRNFKNKHELLTGVEWTRYEVFFRQRANPATSGSELGFNEPANILSLFANYYIPDWNKFMLDVGLRAIYSDRSNNYRLEPRVFLNYTVNDHFTVKSSAGYYSQFITQNVFFEYSDLPIEKLTWQLVENDERVIKSQQFLLGGSYQADKWIFDFDGYLKNVDGLTTNGPARREGSPPEKLIGSIFTRGVDLLIKRKINDFDVWANYTFSKTELNFPRLLTDDFPANYDQAHQVNITSTYNRGRFRASLGWLLSSGIPDYSADPFFPRPGPTTVGSLGEPGTLGEVARYGTIHQLDVSAAYQVLPDEKRTRLTLGISVLNLYNRENLLETVSFTRQGNPNRPAPVTSVNRYTIGFAPDFMIKLEW